MEFQRLKQLIHAGLRDGVKDEDRWKVAQLAAECAAIHIQAAEKEVDWLKKKISVIENDFKEAQKPILAKDLEINLYDDIQGRKCLMLSHKNTILMDVYIQMKEESVTAKTKKDDRAN